MCCPFKKISPSKIYEDPRQKTKRMARMVKYDDWPDRVRRNIIAVLGLVCDHRTQLRCEKCHEDNCWTNRHQ
jgi:hypothetical protein